MIKITFKTTKKEINYKVENIKDNNNIYVYYLNDKKIKSNDILKLRNYLKETYNFNISELLYNISELIN